MAEQVCDMLGNFYQLVVMMYLFNFSFSKYAMLAELPTSPLSCFFVQLPNNFMNKFHQGISDGQ